MLGWFGLLQCSGSYQNMTGRQMPPLAHRPPLTASVYPASEVRYELDCRRVFWLDIGEADARHHGGAAQGEDQSAGDRHGLAPATSRICGPVDVFLWNGVGSVVETPTVATHVVADGQVSESNTGSGPNGLVCQVSPPSEVTTKTL